MVTRVGSALLGAAIAIAGAWLVACFDLFHPTGDILTACEIDAQAPGCSGPAADGGGKPPTDFCAWSHTEARVHARHACAWLGACQPPAADGAFGACMVQALLAYDCAANPNHQAKGKAHDLWDCLSAAATCGDVAACTGAAATDDGGPPCLRSGCYDSRLRWCMQGEDIGLDCAGNGAQRCDGFPDPSMAAWVACIPESDAGVCTLSYDALCVGGSARSCATGIAETIDCQSLLEVPGACVPGPIAHDFDWTSPCQVVPPQCTTDTCVDGGVSSCARGAPFAVDCATEGLGACRLITTDPGTMQPAACAPPSRGDAE
jgi:hypothetical protein